MSSKADFPYIDPKMPNYKNLLTKFNDGVKAGKHTFLFLFMDGCGPCKDTKPNWNNIKKYLKKEHAQNGEIVVAQINQNLFKELQNVGKEPMGYPCFRYIKNHTTEEYENCGIAKTDRSAESFTEWIDSKLKGRAINKTKKAHQDGGRKPIKRGLKRGGKWSLKYKRSINCRHPKGFSQRAHCKSKSRTMKRK
jgi:hypothetical protein